MREVDIDEKYIYSNVITFELTPTRIVKVYPNPFSQTLTLVINTTEAADASDHVEFYSLTGSVLDQRTLLGSQNNTAVQLNDLPPMANGVYIMKIYLNEKTETVKIIKQ